MLETKIQNFFIEKGITLSLAESCTGGAIAARLVQIPDSSLYFLGGVVAYSNASKERMLGVSTETLNQYGAVSEETARAMAQGALESFHSDYALATTGIAGPSGGSHEKPVGTVCFAIASRQNKIFSTQMHFQGERQRVIDQALESAFVLLWEQINS